MTQARVTNPRSSAFIDHTVGPTCRATVASSMVLRTSTVFAGTL